jgi:hypothetical protein
MTVYATPDTIDTVSELVKYAMVYSNNGQFVALDSASGGYPYATNSFTSAKLWSTPEAAISYLPSEETFDLAEVTIQVKLIERPTPPLTDEELIAKLYQFSGMNEAGIDDRLDEYRDVMRQARERLGD